MRSLQTAQALYAAVVACYSLPATAALSRLLLHYLFPKLSAFATVEDLVSHLRTSDARYRAALPAEFLDKNTPLIVVAVGAAHGTPRTPFFEGCSPSPLAPSYASAAAVDVLGAEDVRAASARGKRRSSKGKGGRCGGGGSGGGGGGSSGGGGGSGGSGGGRSGGGSGGFGSGGGGSGGGGNSGGSGSPGGRAGATQRGGSGGGQRQHQQRQSGTPSPQQLREWFSQHGAFGGSGSCPNVIRTAAVPRFASMLLAPEGDPDAPDIPTARSYAEATTGPYFSQWQAAMDAEMASWKSTCTYVNADPPSRANIVKGMWIFRVKRPPGSPPAFKALAAQRDYELHSLDFSRGFLRDSLHEEIWLRRPSGFTRSFPAGTQWSLWRPVYGLHQAPREWHDTLKTTLAALGFTHSTADPSLFLRINTSLPPFYVLVYVDDHVFATVDTKAQTLVKSELQKRHTCTDMGELRSYLGLEITWDRARRTITLTQSHMVHQVLQRFGFQFSSPQPTPLSTGHSLSAPPLDESVEPSGPYLELVGCLMYLMTCTRPDLAYPLSLLARYVAPVCRACAWRTGSSCPHWSRRRFLGYTFSLGSGSVSWRSTRSSSVLSSSCEAEIYAGSMAAQELRWLTYLLTDLEEQPRSPLVLHKYGPDGELTRYKSRLVAKGFQQTKGKDFDEIFAPVGKGTTLRVMLGTAANRGWRIKQMDITTAFLNGIIQEELYMLQPEGLDDGSVKVCRLKKAIYGLKQAPRAWYHKLEETLLAGGFKKSECDHSLFLLQEKEQFLMLLVYVDNILLFSESSAMIERRKYCEGLAEKYGLQDGGKPATPLPSGFTVEPCADEEVVGESDRKLFHSMMGALNYAANHTRPDIAFATSRLACVVSRPSHEQLEAAKRLVRYVSATASLGLEYSAVRQRLQRGAGDLSKGEMLLTCYTDASFNSVKADGTSIGGYVCLFGGGAVSWRSKKQNEVGLSSCETEYMALHHGVKEVVWLKHLLEEIGVCQREPKAPQPLGPSAPATAATAAATAATATAATATATATAAPACYATMASLRVLTFDHEGRPVQFDTWLDNLQLYLLSDSKDSVLLFELASGAAPAPPATADTFATVEDLISHLRASDARYRATVLAEFLDRNLPPMLITLYFIVTRLPDFLRPVRDHFLSLDPTPLTVDLLKQHLLVAERLLLLL
ncbi:unnamed protein product [Closterium sp. NIES-53]